MSQHAHDILAEQALLGAAILAHEQTLPAFLSVPEKAYYTPKHQLLAGVIRDMVIRQQPVDQVTIISALQETGLLPRVGGASYLLTLVSRPYVAVNADWYASRIVELYGRRELWEECTREAQRLDADWESGELARSISASVGTLRSKCDEVINYSAVAQVSEPQSLDDFLRGTDAYDWLVPGLLERGDRVILTGAEGFGKTELTTQLVMSVAGSVHPFTGQPTDYSEPRVLIVDCENPEGLTRRRYRRIAGAIDSARAMWEAEPLNWGKRVKIENRRGGLNLLDPADVAWLEALVANASPDLLALGPLYKLHNGNVNDAEQMGTMLRTIDRLRERHGFALLTEAHASKAQSSNGLRTLEPEGSAVFLRWPEFGMGLRRSKDDPNDRAEVTFWRGSREEREWPDVLFRRHAGLLPWGPDHEYFDRVRDRAEWNVPGDDQLMVR
jgi:hypothetical protein